MKVLFLMQVFDPEPQIKGLLLAKELKKLGAQIEIITGFPNYPGGKVYKGYSVRPYLVNVVEGFKITRVFIYPSHNNFIVLRALSYLSFALSSFIAGLIKSRKFDVIYVCGPPVTLGISAIIIGKLRNIPIVYDIQDLWPDSLSASHVINNPLALKCVNFLCDFLYNNSSHIIVQSRGTLKLLKQRGVAKEKISLVYNWSSEIERTRSLQSYSTRKRKVFFDILYAGNVGKAQGLDSLLDVAKIIRDKNKNIRFLIVGDGIELEKLKKIKTEKSLTNVIFLPRVTQSFIHSYYNRADALLVHLKNNNLFNNTIPSKTQSYMAFGKAILMIVNGEASNLIKKIKCGIVASPSKPFLTANAIVKFASLSQSELDKMGLNGKNYYNKYMSIKIGSKRLYDIFSMVRK